MPSIRVNKELNEGTYFLTFTVKNWYYVLDRHYRWNIIANSLKYFQKNKEFKLYGFVFMINHLHLIAFSKDMIGFVRDFKKFVAREVLKNIKQTEPNMLKMFRVQVRDTEPTVRDTEPIYEEIKDSGQRPELTIKPTYEFWNKTNMPELIISEKFFLQKMNYIHENPLKRNYVMKLEDWYWSSANKNCELKIDSWL
jgi:REP element-mobilizing transposase RayT